MKNKYCLPSLVLTLILAMQAGAAEVSQVTIKPDASRLTRMTMYEGQAVVTQELTTALPAGASVLKLQPDFDYWDLETLQLDALEAGRTVGPKSLFWRRPMSGKDQFIQQLVGREVELFQSGRDDPLRGTLLNWQQDTGILLLEDGRQDIFQWDPGLLSIRSIDSETLLAQSFSSFLEASFDLNNPADNLSLAYLNRGLQYSNHYRIVTRPGDKSLDLNLSAHLENHSTTSYNNVSLQLASGDLGRSGEELFSRKMMVMATESEAPASQRFVDLLFIDVPGTYSLPAKGELSVPLFDQHGSRYENTYKYSFYGNSHPGNRAIKEHPKRVLTFTADSDLPAGPVQVLEQDSGGVFRLVSVSSIPQTAAGQPVALALGESYTLTVERKRLVTRQQSGQWQADWQLVVTNSQDQDVTLNLEDTDRSLMHMQLSKPVIKQGEGYSVSIPAGQTTTLTFTSTYRKN